MKKVSRYVRYSFLWKWLVCSWLHRKTWTQLNKLGNYRWVKVSGRCYPRCDVPEGQPGSDEWHCTVCTSCLGSLASFFGQEP